MGNGAGKNEMAKNRKINVQGNEITIIGDKGHEYISLTDMLKEPLIKARRAFNSGSSYFLKLP